MFVLNQTDLYFIAGANVIIVATQAALGTYAAAATLIKATQTLNEFGHTLGERVFNRTHKDVLGQMEFREDHE